MKGQFYSSAAAPRPAAIKYLSLHSDVVLSGLNRNKTVCLIWIKGTQVGPERPEGKVTPRPLIFMEQHGCRSGTLHVFYVSFGTDVLVVCLGSAPRNNINSSPDFT